ncbi:MAG: hypothetical protein EPN94_01980 [Nitrospirae bacterium]|nr:MAG: hypothetical protein EPN94_01980 [Nitrospirota bacterium]
MKNELKTFIFYEIGDSCRADFLMKDKKFQSTEDAVVIGIENGADAKDALRNLKRECPWIKKYKLDNLVAREVGKVVYL